MKTNTLKTVRPILFASVALLALTARRLSAATLTVTSAADSGVGTLRAALVGKGDGNTVAFLLTALADDIEVR